MRGWMAGVVAPGLPGCIVVARTETETQRYTIDAPYDRVNVDVGSGDLVVLVNDGPTTVEETLGWRDERPTTTIAVIDGALTIDVRCDADWFDGCSADHVVRLDHAVPVTGLLGSGDIDVSDAASIDLSTGSGDVTLAAIAGDVVADTSSGDVDASGLRSDAWISTGSGDVSLVFDAAPSFVDVNTGSGDVEADLPRGSYALALTTGSGDVTVRDLDDAGSSDREVTIHTGRGDIDVNGR